MAVLILFIMAVLFVKLVSATINGFLFVGCKSYQATVKEMRGLIESEAKQRHSNKPVRYTQVYEVVVSMDGEERHFSMFKDSSRPEPVRSPGQTLRVLYQPQENRMTEWTEIVIRPFVLLAGVAVCLVVEYLLLFCNLG